MTTVETEADGQAFCVLVNDEEQYSLFPQGVPPPEGWRATGVEGERDHCLAFVDATWTDLRPRSLRKAQSAPAGAVHHSVGGPA